MAPRATKLSTQHHKLAKQELDKQLKDVAKGMVGSGSISSCHLRRNDTAAMAANITAVKQQFQAAKNKGQLAGKVRQAALQDRQAAADSGWGLHMQTEEDLHSEDNAWSSFESSSKESDWPSDGCSSSSKDTDSSSSDTAPASGRSESEDEGSGNPAPRKKPLLSSSQVVERTTPELMAARANGVASLPQAEVSIDKSCRVVLQGVRLGSKTKAAAAATAAPSSDQAVQRKRVEKGASPSQTAAAATSSAGGHSFTSAQPHAAYAAAAVSADSKQQVRNGPLAHPSSSAAPDAAKHKLIGSGNRPAPAGGYPSPNPSKPKGSAGQGSNRQPSRPSASAGGFSLATVLQDVAAGHQVFKK